MVEADSEAQPPYGAVVHVRHLTKRFKNNDALVDFSLTLRHGEAVALLGANGSGKSTALRLLAGILLPDAGVGTVLGWDLFRSVHALRAEVGFQPQHFALPGDLTAREILRFRARLHDLPAPRLAAERALEKYGLRSLADRRADRLSGGWRARLQLAATLLHDPRLILLDEPTAGLDLLARAWTWRQLGDLRAQGAAIVISTHDLEEAAACSHVMFMAEGAQLASGPPSDFIDPAAAQPQTPVLGKTLTALLSGRTPPAAAERYP